MTQSQSENIPSREIFSSLAREHQIIPVTRALVADTMTPVGVFLSAVGSGDGFLLESVEGGERWGRYSFVGRNPLAIMTSQGGTLSSVGERFNLTGDGIFSMLETLLDSFSVPDFESLPPLHSGVVGYLGYDTVREIERLESPPLDDRSLPDAAMAVIGELIAFDHWRQRITLIVNVVISPGQSESEIEAAYDAACLQLDQLALDSALPVVQAPLRAPEPGAKGELAQAHSTMTSKEYQEAVKVAKEYITAGDIFQVVLSQRFDIEGTVDAFAVYRALRLLNPSPYLYFLRLDGIEIAGSSPEPMVRVRDGIVTSRPIAGSRPRGETSQEDDRLAGELQEDPKEIAEHIMLVDLARNDVGRVAVFGSEHVEELMSLEKYSHVMHLTSQVSGTLRENLGPIDVLRATLPAGTLSGAPKVRAMEIIDELERTRRGVYGGVVGYLDFSGNVDTAIAIRTLVVAPDGQASVQAGAGIVADSDPQSEDAECRSKAAAVLAAVSLSRASTSQ